MCLFSTLKRSLDVFKLRKCCSHNNVPVDICWWLCYELVFPRDVCCVVIHIIYSFTQTLFYNIETEHVSLSHLQLAQTMRDEAKKLEHFRERQKEARKKVPLHSINYVNPWNKCRKFKTSLVTYRPNNALLIQCTLLNSECVYSDQPLITANIKSSCMDVTMRTVIANQGFIISIVIGTI